ncbi:putative DNA-binding transcriptional regulator YafY [Saccharothrix ecbatanensis]|uniref:Putative DNA-binding transcriptional regulator YafY n=1 Tax=Saccharothrix ecbatanensis TaxID=1105145 RepID=A0A7W9HIK6_9PSEU|nr:WYL domain-containing protein [Saccharothrix ecbatanensis]MBB5802509.1 putative DNA-binding transcriptional regulator YafY [Saccharothrix ecbatanensis]
MRADRLVATLLLMQARGQVTAAEVAGELEVSLATARRDLEALSAAGVPVYPQPGRGGGWRLVGRARTDLSGLTSSEAQALFLLVGPAAAGSPEVRAALRKLVRALPETFREGAQAAADAVVVDVAGWGAVGRDRPGLVEVLQEAVVRRLRVELVYEGRGRSRSERVVEPWGLVDKDEVWYLVAGTGAGERTFRVDRVVSARVTDEVFARPADFDLSAAWDRVVSEVERRRSTVSAVVSVEARYVSVLRDQFGRHCEVLEDVDGRARLRLSAPAPLMIAQVLAGWGALVEVVESDGVRAELARLGSELVARYG